MIVGDYRFTYTSVHNVAGWVVTTDFCRSTPMFWMIMLSPYSRSK